MYHFLHCQFPEQIKSLLYTHKYIAQITGMIASLRCYRVLFYSPSLSFSSLSLSNEFQLANNFPPYPPVTAFLSHLLVIKWIDFCSLWVINPTGLERLQRGSHREAFLMDSHREPSIHRANEIGLQDRGFREERENSCEETHVQWDVSQDKRKVVLWWETSWR